MNSPVFPSLDDIYCMYLQKEIQRIFCGFLSAYTYVYYPNEEFYSLSVKTCYFNDGSTKKVQIMSTKSCK